MPKLPSFQFYPGDWRKDPELARASKAEKGMMIDVMCLMHEAEDRGILATSRAPWSDDDIAAAAGGDMAANLVLLQGLLQKGILRRNSSGAVFSARMVRDESIRQQRKKDGLKGGNPALVKGRDNQTTPSPVIQNGPPSSSSSVSSSSSKLETKDSPATAVGRLQKLFREELDKTDGKEAVFNFGQLGAILKRRLKETPEEQIAERIVRWFSSTEPWVARNRNLPGVFDSKFHQLKDGPITAKGGKDGRPRNGFRRDGQDAGGAPKPPAVTL